MGCFTALFHEVLCNSAMMHAIAKNHDSRPALKAALAFVLAAGILSGQGETTADVSPDSILRTYARQLASNMGQSVVNVHIISGTRKKRIALASFSGMVLQGETRLILACCDDRINLLEEGAHYLEITYEDLWCGRGTLIQRDARTGLCLIRSTRQHGLPRGITLPVLKKRNAPFIPKPQLVLTVSNPFGINHTVRYGMVCTADQCVKGAPTSTYQLHLPAMPGEGGGVVCNLSGELMGMIKPVPGLNRRQGMHLPVDDGAWPNVEVIPAPVLHSVVHYLRAGKKVLRGWVGVKFSLQQQNTAADAGTAGHAARICVDSMAKKGAAQAAGLQLGDVVLRANNRPINSMADLYQVALWVEYEGLGKDLLMVVQRGPEKQVRTVVIPVQLRPNSASGTEAFTSQSGDGPSDGKYRTPEK